MLFLVKSKSLRRFLLTSSIAPSSSMVLSNALSGQSLQGITSLMSAPMIGSTVDVRGLEVHSELNGERGTVESIATDLGRYGVKLTRGELVAVKIENLYSPESWQCPCGHKTARTDVRRKEEGIREEMESAILDAHCTLNLVTPKRLDDRKGRRERMLPAFGSWLLRKESQQLERWNAWQLAVVVWR